MIKQNQDVLVIDDVEENVQLLSDILIAEGYEVRRTTSPVLGLQSARANPPGLILLDVQMPLVDGFSVCKELKKDLATHKIPVIFITGLSDSESVVKGFNVGGADYITKPFRVEEVISRVKTHLALRSYEASLEDKVTEATRKVVELNEEVESTQRQVFLIMGTIAEGHSQEVGLHVKRVAEMAYQLARLAGASNEDAEYIRWGAPLHDLGKIAIPDAILHKPAKLNKEEWEIMKTHAEIGYEMLNVSDRPMLRTAATIAREHHEWWDGSGYPRGLKGNEISLAGRVTAIADVFDALANRRCYKDAWQMEDVLAHIEEQRGTHFDPELIDILFNNIDELCECWRQVSNNEQRLYKGPRHE